MSAEIMSFMSWQHEVGHNEPSLRVLFERDYCQADGFLLQLSVHSQRRKISLFVQNEVQRW